MFGSVRPLPQLCILSVLVVGCGDSPGSNPSTVTATTSPQGTDDEQGGEGSGSASSSSMTSGTADSMTSGELGDSGVSSGEAPGESTDTGMEAARCPAGAWFCDDFETGDLNASTNGFAWTGATSTTVVSDFARSGQHSLRFRWTPSTDGEDSMAEQRFDLGDNLEDVWVSYSFHVGSNYVHRVQADSTNNKGWLYLWDGDYGAPSGPGMGPNLWADGQGLSTGSHYVWGPIDRHWWDEDDAWLTSARCIEDSDIGAWSDIYLHYKYASESNDDGVAEIWKRSADGEWNKLLDIHNGDWYSPGQPGFDQGYLWGWSNSGFDEQTDIHVDDVVIGTHDFLGLAG